MKIQTINNLPLNFGTKVVLPANNRIAPYNYKLEELLCEKGSDNLNIIARISNYAKNHNMPQIILSLRKGLDKSLKFNEQGDLLMINSGPKTSTMRIDYTTTGKELEAEILGNIQDNYNISRIRL